MGFELIILIIVGALFVVFSRDITEFSKKLWEKAAFRHLLTQSIVALAIICLIPYLHYAVREILIFYYLGAKYILDIIGPGQIDIIIAKTVMLLVMPLVICLIPQLIFWLIRGRGLKFFYSMLWVCFFILASIVVMR